jgi:hypothetical protein
MKLLVVRVRAEGDTNCSAAVFLKKQKNSLQIN